MIPMVLNNPNSRISSFWWIWPIPKKWLTKRLDLIIIHKKYFLKPLHLVILVNLLLIYPGIYPLFYNWIIAQQYLSLLQVKLAEVMGTFVFLRDCSFIYLSLSLLQFHFLRYPLYNLEKKHLPTPTPPPTPSMPPRGCSGIYAGHQFPRECQLCVCVHLSLCAFPKVV